MITMLAFLDLAARACPKRAEATFFALLMSVFNLGSLASQNVGAHLYTELGEGPSAYLWLVIISTIATARHLAACSAGAHRTHRISCTAPVKFRLRLK
jgi:hypothetical protein